MTECSLFDGGERVRITYLRVTMDYTLELGFGEYFDARITG